MLQPYHSQAVINQDGKVILSLPFPVGERVEIVVLPFDESRDDKDWKELAAREFLRGYTAEDAAYDNY